MLVIHFRRATGPAGRISTQLLEIAIGRGFAEDVVLADPVISEHHCRLVYEAGGWFVVDDDSERGTFIDGARITEPTAIEEHQRLEIGAYVVTIESVALGEREQQLIDRLELGDAADRSVYADWLEEHGHHDRAEFLRVQQDVGSLRPEDPEFVTSTHRLRALAGTIDVEWRMRVARPIVEGCKVAQEFSCSMEWGKLAPTDDPAVRSCGACQQSVHYCTSESEALDLTRQGRCIVLDIGSPRTLRSLHQDRERRHDTAPTRPGGMMAYVAPTRACPSCGQIDVASRQYCGRCGRRL